MSHLYHKVYGCSCSTHIPWGSPHSAIIHSTSGDQPLRVVSQHLGTSFITRVEKCLPFWTSHILQKPCFGFYIAYCPWCLLAEVTRILNYCTQASTHAHTKRIAKLIIYDYYSFSTSRCQAILDLGKRKNWRVWRGLHILMTLLRPQNAINSLTISGKFAFLRKTPFREDN